MPWPCFVCYANKISPVNYVNTTVFVGAFAHHICCSSSYCAGLLPNGFPCLRAPSAAAAAQRGEATTAAAAAYHADQPSDRGAELRQFWGTSLRSQPPAEANHRHPHNQDHYHQGRRSAPHCPSPDRQRQPHAQDQPIRRRRAHHFSDGRPFRGCQRSGVASDPAPAGPAHLSILGADQPSSSH